MANQFTSACFTLNNYTDDDVPRLKAHVPDTIRYLVVGYEVGAEGTPHLQGYCEFTKRPAFAVVKTILGDRCHIEHRKGTAAQAINYIVANPEKPNPVFFEIGIKKGQGRRSDLHKIAETALDAGMREVAACALNAQQIRHAELVLSYLEDKRSEPPTVWWFYGPSGSGKSKAAQALADEIAPGNWYRKGTSSGIWFPGYDAHECLWLDDVFEDYLGPNINTYRTLLEWMDRYPCIGQYKGGQRQLLAKYIIITSVQPPRYLFDDSTGELQRRITHLCPIK